MNKILPQNGPECTLKCTKIQTVEGNASRLPTFGNYDSIHIQHLFSPLALNAFRRPWASYNAYYNNSESDFKL